MVQIILAIVHKFTIDGKDMMKQFLRAVFLLLLTVSVAACGTAATPVFEAPDEEAVVEAGEDAVEVAVQPTETPLPPTATPTDEPTVEPTAVPTEEPTVEPTEEPTQEVAADPIVRLVASRDPAAGEVLFNQMYPETGFACVTCHHVAVPENLIGPSLLGIPDTAATRVEGLSAERYLYESIVHPNDYLVEGFVANVMPQTWGDVMSDTEIYDIIAYLLTLEA
jgi:cytochrome c2/predicted small lipoprotein YifL